MEKKNCFVVGAGMTGMKLASMFDENAILISTAKQDSANFTLKKAKVNIVSEDGASKRFSVGQEIWSRNIGTLKEILKDVNNDKVVVFSSLGGGSGSSSLSYITDILLKQNNKVLVVGIVPYKKEINPPLANSVQAINSLMPYIPKASVILFDNDKLIKLYNNDWSQINEHIIKRVNYLVNLLDKFTIDSYSPLTIDRSELMSVVFGGGFVDVSNDFLEEVNPKFHYGKIDVNTKNLLIAQFVDVSVPDDKVDEYHKILTTVTNKFATRAKNCRFVTGILRGKIDKETIPEGSPNDRAYITIASGLNIDDYIKKIEKIRDDAVQRAINYSTEMKVESIVTDNDAVVLDI